MLKTSYLTSLLSIIWVLCAQCLANFAVCAAEAASIGDAITVEQHVTGSVTGKWSDIDVGTEVFGSEKVRTESDALAMLMFLDRTHLAIGPSSTVTLDKFVYNSDTSAAAVILNTAKGGFRFATGQSDPRAFKINTPVATIGIRGTVLDIKNSAGQSLIVLKRGALQVCVRGSAKSCVSLTEPDQFVIVRKGNVSVPQSGGAKQFDFRNYCVEQSFKSWEACELGGSFLTYERGTSGARDPGPPPAKTCGQRGC